MAGDKTLSATGRHDVVLLLDAAHTHDGILAALFAAGLPHKVADVTDRRWDSYLSDFETYGVIAVLGDLTVPALMNLGAEQEANILRRLLLTNHIFFLHEDIVSGKLLEQAEHETHRRGRKAHETVDQVVLGKYAIPLDGLGALRRGIQMITGSNLHVATYTNAHEVTVAAEKFIADLERGVLFRVYVPAGRIWADEIDRVLHLFPQYLTQVAKLSVRLNQHQTENGNVYTFYSRELNADAFGEKYDEFKNILGLTLRDRKGAEDVLRQYRLTGGEVAAALQKYSREARRLEMDFRHDFEQRFMALRHELETELAEYAPRLAGEETAAIAAAIVPSLADDLPAFTADGFGGDMNITINVNPTEIGRVYGVVANKIYGQINLAPEEEQIFGLIMQHGDSETTDLQSAFFELRDPTLSKMERTTAAQKIKVFLASIAPKVRDVAFNLLEAYLKHRAGL